MACNYKMPGASRLPYTSQARVRDSSRTCEHDCRHMLSLPMPLRFMSAPHRLPMLHVDPTQIAHASCRVGEGRESNWSFCHNTGVGSHAPRQHSTCLLASSYLMHSLRQAGIGAV